MREIKFRGKRADNGEWHFGDIRRFEDSVYIADSTGTVYQVEPDTVGQYIGLIDTSGKELYKGDLCVGPYPWDENYYALIDIPDDGVLEVFAVSLMRSGAKIRGISHGIGTVLENAEMLTVIGNIHDNPELLEVSQ